MTQTEMGQVLEAFETFKAIRAEQEEMKHNETTKRYSENLILLLMYLVVPITQRRQRYRKSPDVATLIRSSWASHWINNPMLAAVRPVPQERLPRSSKCSYDTSAIRSPLDW